MDLLGDSINCTTCKKILQMPVSLPCGHSICNDHAKKAAAEENMTNQMVRCSLFGDLLERFKTIKNDPETRINKEISELKNRVDLRLEEMKEKIDSESFEMIEKIDEFEKECKLTVASLKLHSKVYFPFLKISLLTYLIQTKKGFNCQLQSIQRSKRFVYGSSYSQEIRMDLTCHLIE